ncbi:MAG: hypothetical protein EZS28_049387 [Streblomastix strix]|uniref:Uncharacterized protein n=1 Tax=Streblomastix strix TaxID=222440 RepID=A0A5J4T9K1_9EUKA|nr:MAG: hypothetical protein EZS28_049387 [Streblomastix strix]
MESDQEIQNDARAIVSFTGSYVQNKQRKQNEQQESESTLSLTQVTSRICSLSYQIIYNKGCKQVIRIPKLLQSLIALVNFRLGTHLNEQTDLLRLNVRRQSRRCLYCIQRNGDAQVHSELVRQGYGRATSISFSAAGGVCEEDDLKNNDGLSCISVFLRKLRYGRYDDLYPSFQPLPLLARVSLEQIEEEGANEEIDALMNNKGMNGYIKIKAKDVKAETLNHFIRRRRR